MKESLCLVCAVCAGMVLTTASAADLWTSFAHPPTEVKPWSYYFMQNTLTDKETARAEVADIRRLGFGGILITDSRGYWVDDDHLLLPNEEHVRWGSDAWLDLMAHVVRTCAQNDIRIAINVAASGGHLRGEEDVKGDNPKYLAYKLYRPGESFEKPASPYFRDVAAFTLKTDGTPDFDGAWHGAGDGIFSTAASTSKRKDGLAAKRMPAVVAKDGNVVVRFGYDIMPGIPNDIDVLDRTAVRRHLDKVIGRLIARVPGLVGTDRTLAYCYNVSWEGMMPTWSATFAADYRRHAGYDLMPLLPELAGFDLKGAKPYAELMRDYRASRGKMMCDHMYGEVRRWAHEHGMGAISESGGPWQRKSETFGEQDQLAFLAANDVPQGECWPTVNNCSPDARHAVRYGRFIDRGPVYAGRTYGRPIISSESFTHMHRHYSVDPAFLKPLGDITFANGVNRIVWHAYSTSPRRYGCPGVEYFAGSHINRNVTWTKELPAFVEYLGRCQSLLQWGRPVVDIAVKGGAKPYTGWGTRKNGFFRQKVSEEMDITIPKGYEFDVVGDDALAQNPQLLARYRTVWPAKPDYAPDVETAADWLWTHRTDGKDTEIYFLVGEGDVQVTFRATGKSVEVWDAVTVTRRAARATPTADGRTAVELSLPVGGSCFVVFSPKASDLKPQETARVGSMTVAGPWKVTFENHPFITSPVPAARTMTELQDWITIPGSERKGAPTDLKYFAGTATYETTLDRTALKQNREGRVVLSLGKVPSGIAHVYVGGTDCGTVWCEPWEVDVTKALVGRSPRDRRDVQKGVTLAIRYTNNWYNRFVGDCFLPEGERVLKSNVRAWAKNREKSEPSWVGKPTVYSGFCPNDPLQPSGLLGPVTLVFQDSGARVVRDIAYDPSIGKYGLGDLYLPDRLNDETPLVLVIHGGGWSASDRASIEGVAQFFQRELGFAAFNIEYRLANNPTERPWPACGDDCVKAAEFVLTDAFKSQYGLKHKKIWICGASAGGHLTLWTLVHLDPSKVEGAVSISAIGDPAIDFAAHPGRHKSLFPLPMTDEKVATMDPRPFVTAGMASLLCTHADADAVVPIASHRAFATVYANAGNRCAFFEYAADCEPNEGGHFIWRKGVHPHKLLAAIEGRIRRFVQDVRNVSVPSER